MENNPNQSYNPQGGQNQGPFNQGAGQQGMGQLPIPNATGALVLGILSIVFAGIVGIILGIIGLILSNNGMKAFEMDPSRYKQSSIGSLKAGRICSIIGICISILAIILIIFWIIFVVSMMGSGWR